MSRAEAWWSLVLACWEAEYWRKFIAERFIAERRFGTKELDQRLGQLQMAVECIRFRGEQAVAFSLEEDEEESNER